MAQYIDKDHVVAEIENLRRTTFTNFNEGVNATVQVLLEVLDTLEVKEVDLEKELQSFFYPHVPWGDYCKNEQKDIEEWSFKIAKHFFELGLQT